MDEAQIGFHTLAQNLEPRGTAIWDIFLNLGGKDARHMAD